MKSFMKTEFQKYREIKKMWSNDTKLSRRMKMENESIKLRI